ncbi:MAG: serpin family protein [Pirellulaceae bacterium]
MLATVRNPRLSLTALALVGLFGSIAATAWSAPPLQLPGRSGRQFQPTHILTAETAYYKTGPQQMSPPDGKLKANTPVVLVREAGSYTQVRSKDGLTAYVASDALTKVVPRADITPDTRKVADSVNALAFDLYGRLSKSDGNLFFSPASISSALAMTYAGAAGGTEKEMATVLHFGATGLARKPFHEAFGTLTSLLNSSNERGGYELTTANRLWGQKSFAFRDDFLALTREQYGAELKTVDFAQSEAARREINRWVEEQTRDKIVDLIPSGVLNEYTRLVLTNAVYFNGAWEHEFSKEATKDAPFHLANGDEIATKMMHQQQDFRYAAVDGVQALQLPYVGYEISMIVLLPEKRDGLAALEEKLSAENVDRWIGALRKREVRLQLPKFKLTSQFQLSSELKALGMTTAFSDGADFSRMATGEPLRISEVLHKAFVDVNEQGTEAAAATAVLIEATAAPIPQEPVDFRADHPFVFLLRDNRTGAILFLGRVSDPRG